MAQGIIVNRAEMVQEMKPYHIDFPNVKNNYLKVMIKI